MKKLSTIKLALTFAGCFLGAGYMSGQEPYQFFSSFGWKGLIGIIASVSMLCIMNLVIIKIVSTTKNTQIDKTVVPSSNKVLLFSVGALENIIFFGTFVVMAAGAGALAEKLIGIQNSHIAGSFIFCLIIAFLAIKGIKGLVEIFSAFVPILVIVTVAISFYVIIIKADSGFTLTKVPEFNPFIPNWVAGFSTFASYNLFCSIGVLCPVALQIKSRKAEVLGTIFGGILLIVVALAVIVCMATIPSSLGDELPMLAIASSISPIVAGIYSILLFLSMISASLACVIPNVTYLGHYMKASASHKATTTFILCGIGFILSCFGFADLVGTLFSSFGYISLVGIISLLIHYYKVSKKSS